MVHLVAMAHRRHQSASAIWEERTSPDRREYAGASAVICGRKVAKASAFGAIGFCCRGAHPFDSFDDPTVGLYEELKNTISDTGFSQAGSVYVRDPGDTARRGLIIFAK